MEKGEANVLYVLRYCTAHKYRARRGRKGCAGGGREEKREVLAGDDQLGGGMAKVADVGNACASPAQSSCKIRWECAPLRVQLSAQVERLVVARKLRMWIAYCFLR